MKKLFSKRLFSLPFVLVFTLFLAVTVLAETYTATTMRLLRYEGTVEIVDSSGKSGLVMENIRLNSGESLHTGAASSASVGLDSTKIVTLDENTKVDFTKQSNAIQLSLAEGSFFLDVSEKLSEDQTMDVKTSTMTVGIRGTVVLLSNLSVEEYQRRLTLQMEEGQASDQQSDSQPASGQNAGSASGTENVSLSSLEERIMQTDANGGVVSMLGILEGRVQLDYVDQNGESHSVEISAGQKATLLDSDENGQADVTPEVDNVTLEDLFDAAKKEIERDPALQKRLQDTGYDVPGGGSGGNEGADSSYPANEEWTISSPVTVVAQSASKMFDGQPLTRTGDILVQGLPEGFTCRAVASGSRTDAGSGENPIGSFSIYNKKGEDVTRHFTNIDKVSGKLTIDPAPLAAWSGSASKVYDGTPLTCSDTKLSFSAGRETINYAGKNLSYVLSENSPAAGRSSNNGSSSNTGNSSSAATGQASDLPDTQTLYGICGTVLVHGSNPLTGEVKEIALSAGQKLTVHLSDKNNETSIDYVIETITEEQIPEDILRIYADNPDIMTQACAETMWDPEKLAKLIEQLPPVQPAENTENAENTTSDVNGVKIDSLTSDNLMEDCTNVRITIDTEGTNYNNRPLNKEEAHYTPMKADPSIKIVPTASITDVGTVNNTFTIDWGSANKNNYTLSETTGTLTVTPASATVRTGSAEKEYDGTPLTNSEASISGLVHGETASVTATGSITGVGSKSNSYSIDWGSAKEKNYDVSSHTGTLKVTENKSEISIKVTVSGKTYDGKPLDIDTVVTSDDSVQTSSKQFKTSDSAAKQARNSNASSKQGKTSDASSKKQVKTAAASQSTNKVTVEGLPSGFTFKAHITGSRTDAGTSELTIESYQILDPDGKDVSDSFSNVKIVNNTLTIDPAEATVTTGSASKEYDGTPLTSSEASISGLTDADKDTVKVTATGSITDVGIADNTYTIDWGSAKNSNYTLSENLGTLEVTESSGEITFRAPTAEKTYDGTALEAGEVSVAGLPEGFTFTATADGSQTDTGSSESTVVSYSIFDADGNDVTASFSNISTENGTLTVNPAEATVTTGSATKEYDGKELTNSEASISGLTDADKAVVTVTATGKITEVGTADNTYSIDWGTAKEGNYTVSDSKGSLEVTKNTTEITFKAPSASKTYDGTALKPSAVTTDGLPEGFTFTATADGSQTDAGSSESTVASYKILDAGEKDVTANFAGIKTEKGTLTVNPAAATVTTGSAEKAYDGSPLTKEDASITGLVGNDASYITVTATGSITDVGSTDNSYSIDWGSAKSSNYTLTETLGKLKVDKLKINMDWGDITEEYNGTTHAGLVKLKFLNGERAGETVDYPEEDYWTYDTGKYVYYLDTGDNFTVVWNRVGPAPGKYTITPTYSFDTDKTDNYEVSLTGTSLTIEEAELKITTKTASKAYDGSPLTSTEVTISGLAGGETVTATATGTITDAGSVKNNYTIDWGTTNKNNYKVTETIGTLTVEPLILNISLGSPITNYDHSPHGGYPTLTYGNGDKKGETLSFHDVESADLGGGFAVNYAPAGDDMLHVVGYGDGPDAGTYTLVCNTSFTSGKAGNYKVNVTDNTLTINKREAIVYTGSAEKYYDGKALTNTSATDNYVSGLLSHEFATVTATGSIREAGSTENTYTIDWGSTNPDNYKLTEKLGILTVKVYDDPVTISTPSATKTYDGTRIDTSTVTVTGLPSGFTCEAYTGGMYAKVDAGTYENDLHDMSFTYTDEDGNMYAGWRYYAIYDASENDVTKAFTNVKTELGTLTIKQATAVVTTGSASGPTGTMYPVTSDEASITGLADIDKPYVTITATGIQSSEGSSDNTYKIQWGTTEHPVNSENYKIEEHLGTLTMYNAALTPPVGSAVPSKKGTTDDQSDNPADTGSTQEKDTKTGNDDGNAASDQAGDGSEKSEQAADKPDQTSENTDTKSDQSEQTSENADSKEDQPEQASENTDSKSDQAEQASENADSKEDQPEQASENAESKEDQPDRTSESSEKSSDASKEPAKESSEEVKKDTSEESKKDTSEESKKESSEESNKSVDKESKKSNDSDSKKSEPAENKNENKKSEMTDEKKSDEKKPEEKKSEKAEVKKKEKTEAKDSENPEKKDARKDSDDGNEAAPAEVPAASEKKDQKDSEE